MNATGRERSRDEPWAWAALAVKCAACVAVIGLLAAIGLGAAGNDVTTLAAGLPPVVAP